MKQIPPPPEKRYTINLDPAIKEAVLVRDNFQCQLCGTENSISPHHIVPKSQGGTDHISNLIILCFNCHRSLHDKPNTVFVRYMMVNGEQIPILFKKGRHNG